MPIANSPYNPLRLEELSPAEKVILTRLMMLFTAQTQSSFDAALGDTSSTVASSSATSAMSSTSSTPPTSIDSASLASEPSKSESLPPIEPTASVNEASSAGRARRARAGTPVYNLAQLSGTASHGRRRSKGDALQGARTRAFTEDIFGPPRSPRLSTIERMEDTIRVATPLPDPPLQGADKLVRDGVDALDLQWSMKKLKTPRTTRRRMSERPQTPSTRSSSRLATRTSEPLANKLSQLGRKGRKAMEKGAVRMPRELRRLQDTKEFAHVDDEPVVHTVWSKGKLVVERGPEKAWPARRRAKIEEVATKEEEKQDESRLIIASKGRRAKKYLDRGLYAGQDLPLHMTMGLTNAEKKKLSQVPELTRPPPSNKTMPLPIFNGMRLLLNGRDFKLPFNVCNPMPPGQPKPDEWRKMTKNRFIGDSLYYWKKSPYLSDLSTCVCRPEDGCGEDCQNRIMLYECDDVNCNVGKEHCTNRAFASLMERKAKGGKYRIGVEVVKTADRGYGVRSNRCFEAGQIIMEYTGEIITEEECDRRMNEIYKDNECYYLMSFDQNMIIDATTGSIARFVNHSCNPNCRMIKWIVAGQPRMALFAGDKPIMTGEELTYDYNFDPFSAKNVQKCLCGEKNCRGVLGPKPKEVKPKDVVRTSPAKHSLKGTKRKLKELTEDEEEAKPVKKRKIKPTLKRSMSDASVKASKGAVKGALKGAKAVKRSVSTLSPSAKTALGSKKTAVKPQRGVGRRARTGSIPKTPVMKHQGSGRIRKTYGKSPRRSPQSRSYGTNPFLAGEEAEAAKKLTAKGSRGRVSATASKVMKKTESPYEKTYTSTSLRRRVMEALDDNAKATKRPRLAKTGSLASSPRNGTELSRKAVVRMVTPDADPEITPEAET